MRRRVMTVIDSLVIGRGWLVDVVERNSVVVITWNVGTATVGFDDMGVWRNLLQIEHVPMRDASNTILQNDSIKALLRVEAMIRKYDRKLSFSLSKLGDEDFTGAWFYGDSEDVRAYRSDANFLFDVLHMLTTDRALKDVRKLRAQDDEYEEAAASSLRR